jgi:hypothetical protein
MNRRQECRVSSAELPRVRASGWPVAASCKCSRAMACLLKRALLATLLSLSFAASADEAKPVKVIRQPDKVIVRKRTVVDFGDVTVEGELVKPEGSYVLNRNKTRFDPLIQLRDDFDAELRNSADNL